MREQFVDADVRSGLLGYQPRIFAPVSACRTGSCPSPAQQRQATPPHVAIPYFRTQHSYRERDDQTDLSRPACVR